MTVQAIATPESYVGNGVTTLFPVNFNFFLPSDLLVTLVDTTSGSPVTSTLVLNGTPGYSVAGGLSAVTGLSGNGSITTSWAPTAYQTIIITPNFALTQQTHYVPNSPFPAASHENALDRLTLIAQQNAAQLALALTIPASSLGVNTKLPAPAPGMVLGWDGTAQNLVNVVSGAGSGAALQALLASPAAGQGPALIPGLPFVTLQGADPTGATDSSAAIQTALATGKSLVIPPGTYKANNLTMTTSYQRLVALGAVTIQKNANGPIITISGQYECELNGIKFMGDASTPVYTGDNIVVTAAVQTVRIHNCGSMWAYGRALKSYAGRTEVIGSNPIWQTADATATGYDLEIGVSGTATLYHLLHGVNSSQATGGIILTDTGASSIMGCSIGKVNTAFGTGASGSGGNKFVGNRIKGALTIDQSNTVFGNNLIDAVAVTITTNAASGVVLDESNVYASGATITNSGGGANIVRKAVSVAGYQAIRYGDDTWTPTLQVAAGGPVWWRGTAFALDNNKGFQQYRSDAGGQSTVLNLNATGLYVGDGLATGANSVNINSGVLINFNASSATQWQISNAGLYPATDNSVPLGKSGNRPTVIWAATSTISTSDAREKTAVQDSDLGLDFIRALHPVSYQWIVGRNQVDVIEPPEVDEDGHVTKEAVVKVTPVPGKRVHYGLLAQEVKQILGDKDFAGWTIEYPVDPESRQGLRYEQFVGPLIKAVQELAAKVAVLEAKD